MVTLRRIIFTVRCLTYDIRRTLYVVHTVSTLFIFHYQLYGVRCTVYVIQHTYTHTTTHCTLYIVHLYSVQLILIITLNYYK